MTIRAFLKVSPRRFGFSFLFRRTTLQDGLKRIPSGVGMPEPETPHRQEPQAGEGGAVPGNREEALRAMVDELRQNVRELEQFAYVVSHDLQAPLRSVIGFSQLLSRRHKEQLSGEALEFLGYIEHSAQQAQTLIQELLRLSRIGREPRLLQSRALSDTVHSAMKRLGERLTSEVRVQITGLPEVNTDHGLLAQLLEQLLDNAIKFRRPDLAPLIAIEARREGSQWFITVADNGIGIPQDQLEAIFLVFRRVHAADVYPGTGIGLTIARKIARLLGGSLNAAADDRGSRFTLQLPVVPVGLP